MMNSNKMMQKIKQFSIVVLFALLTTTFACTAFGATDVTAYSTTSASTSASTDVATMGDVRMASFSNAMVDFGYSLRSMFTFRAESKLELIADRNEELRERQREWILLHDRIVMNTELSAEERQEALEQVQAHNEAIIEDHNELVISLQKVRSDANASGNSELYVQSQAQINSDNMSTGSSSGVRADLDLRIGSQIIG